MSWVSAMRYLFLQSGCRPAMAWNSRRARADFPGPLSTPRSVRPLPVPEFGLVDAVLVGIVLAVDLEVAKLLLRMCSAGLELRHAINHVHGQREPVDLILDGKLERRVNVPLLL